MQKTAYRLAEYKIIENEHGDLWWETHAGFGSLKTGKCFINGDILFIKPSDGKEAGFLKGEFLDHLNRLPRWVKTKYYCASYKIYTCKSGSRKPIFEDTNSRMHSRPILRKNESTQKESAKGTRELVKADTTDYISYKLHRHEITEKNNGQLFWESYSGMGRLKKGRCHIKGSILLLEDGETDLSGFKKREFLKQLMRLPDWEKSKYFCTSYTIYYSKTGTKCESLAGDNILNRDETKNVFLSNKKFGADIKIKPINLNKTIIKDELNTFFNFCNLLVMLILNLLLGFFKILYKASRIFIAIGTRFRD